jgi:hypothetical protein
MVDSALARLGLLLANQLLTGCERTLRMPVSGADAQDISTWEERLEVHGRT